MKYLLVSSQRSGSSFLSKTLSHVFNERNDGPDEWIVNADTRKNLGLQSDYKKAHNKIMSNIEHLIELMSPNSHRKAMYSHLGDPSLLPEEISVIHLIRRDTWAQAKSLWIMNSGLFPPHVKINNTQSSKPKLLTLDTNTVIKIAKELRYKKKLWFKALNQRKNVITLFYEEDLLNKDHFQNSTLPKIEQFFDKKKEMEDYVFPYAITSNLYILKNLDKKGESKLKKRFYLNDKYLNSSLYVTEDFIFRIRKKLKF